MERYFVPAFSIWISSVQEVAVTKPCRSKFVKDYREHKACNNTCNSCESGSSLPEHTQEEHGKYTRAYEARVFLNIGKTTNPPNATLVFEIELLSIGGGDMPKADPAQPKK